MLETLLRTIVSIGSIVLLAAGAIHIGWAFGLPGASLALPSDEAGEPLRVPHRLLTIAVALGLFLASAILIAVLAADGIAPPRVVLWVGAFVFIVRAVGDRRTIGLTKSRRDTPFARRDDRYFTPIVILLALSYLAALAL